MNNLSSPSETQLTGSAEQPLVSVIVPTYNCAPFLAEALDSILIQEYQNLEVIVVDDGSSDGSADIAEAYGPPVKVIRQKNQGPAAARNRGVRESHGEYLAFLDGDDVWLPGKLSAQINWCLSHPEAGIVYGGFKRWPASKPGVYPSRDAFISPAGEVVLDDTGSGWIYHHLLLDSIVCIITAVIPRTLFESLGGFDESLRVGEDYDFWLRASRLVQAHKLTKYFALYRVNPSSSTFIPRTVNNELMVVLGAVEKHGLASPNGNSISEKQIRGRFFQLAYRHGYLHYWHGSPCIALAEFSKAFNHDSKHLRAIVYCFMSYIRCKLTSVLRSS